MLNYIWAGMIIIGFIISLFTGRIEHTVNALLDSAQDGVRLVISLLGIMCFWCGIMEIANASGMVEKLTKFIKPVSRILFKNVPENHPALSSIFMNISANILGLGNASTPLGLKAMEDLQKINKDKNTASDDMCMFVLLNTASLQIIPTSIIAIRAAAGSSNPTDIIVYIWLGSVTACLFSIILCKVLSKKRK